MLNRLVSTMAIAAVLLPATVTAQQQSRQQINSARLGTAPAPVTMNAEPRQAKAQVFTDAKLGFTVVAPPGASIADNTQAKQVVIRSHKGFAVNIQAGATRPDVPLERMSALLETRYLGDGRPWSARGQEKSLRIAGLPAHEVDYSGSNSRARVVVARGPQNDYVFIFMAPHHQFVKLGYEFDWILQNFKPSPHDLTQARAPQPVAVQPAALAMQARPANDRQRFSDPGFGYEIEYPADWEINKPAAMSAMFSGREGTPAYAAIIGVQNIQPAGAANGDEAAQRAFNQIKASLGNAVRDLKVLNEAPWTYQRDGRRLVGRQVSVSYVHAGHRFMKQMIVIPRPSGTVAHVWSYTAPEREFASFQPVAAAMLSSWRILTADAR